ncbi:MAG TPA: ABC transporter ATP-binding protein [Devosiaceae bacterium]|jgi:ATP-binding cassette subfamily B multidrug efflux pump
MLSWFERRLDPFPSDTPTLPPRTLLAFCLFYIRGAKRWLAIMAVLTALIALSEVTLFGLMGNVVDWLSNADRTTFLATEGWKLWAMGLYVLVALPLIIAFQSFVIHQTMLGNVPQRIRWWMHRYVIRQSMTYFQDEMAGRIANNVMQTALAVRETVMKLLDVLNYVVVYFIGAVILASTNDWRLAVPFVIWLTAYCLLLRWFVPRLAAISEQQANARSNMTGRIVDGYTNIATVKLFSHSQREELYARDAMEEFLVTVYRQMRLASVLNILIYCLNVALLAAVCGIGIALWLNEGITPGAIAAAAALVLRFFGMSQWIMWEMSALFENIGTVRNGMNAVAVPRLVPDRPEARPIVVSSGEVRFEHVSFHYGKKRAVIEDLSLVIKPGERVGLVGRSGAGKSTLVNLLLRFYDLEGGRILVDGQDIAEVSQDSLRANIGVVSQDTSLLHRSVRDNLIYGRPSATEEQMIAAARSAEAHDFILGLGDFGGRHGYDAFVGERGVKLSGGQRQRIAIARVLLKDAPILILDEATSALDSEVEAAIQSQLHTLMADKTVIAIAHRLSTIAAMDRLIVLDQGRIVEEGTHAQLLTVGGHYARLWQRQSGGFLEADDDTEETPAE